MNSPPKAKVLVADNTPPEPSAPVCLSSRHGIEDGAARHTVSVGHDRGEKSLFSSGVRSRGSGGCCGTGGGGGEILFGGALDTQQFSDALRHTATHCNTLQHTATPVDRDTHQLSDTPARPSMLAQGSRFDQVLMHHGAPHVQEMDGGYAEDEGGGRGGWGGSGSCALASRVYHHSNASRAYYHSKAGYGGALDESAAASGVCARIDIHRCIYVRSVSICVITQRLDMEGL